ncbi:4Fe-4S binding protein [Geopsychrobacter electrodiphilus]|uniref:4Fe-4S binding protein n=1 Tax=Geopsychrobacter electrodiphilus TaxID=225196 RepID=UPI0003634316|nr:4Fe-4S binding protein [Geopsychrobacter electrodiphilus]
MIEQAYLIYFSPTGTTRKISESIARGLGAKEVIHYDLTLPGANCEAVITRGVALIGVPVYAGRVPELCLTRMAEITSTGVPAILVALYGNREFEDALIELRDVSTVKGFQVIAAGAFIGEHSYSTPASPIAKDRPDTEDQKLAFEFGRKIAEKIAQGKLDTPPIAGNLPYKDRVKLGGIAPETEVQKCTLCGKCAEVCPTGVVGVTDSVLTDAAGCVMCCACVKACAFDARALKHQKIGEKRALLVKNCSVPKAPTLFV